MEKKQNKNIASIITIALVIIFVIVMGIWCYLDKNNAETKPIINEIEINNMDANEKKKTDDLSQELGLYDEIIEDYRKHRYIYATEVSWDNDYLVVKKNNDYHLIDLDNNIIDTSTSRIEYIYNGYYLINDTIKRNGKVISTIDNSEPFKLYKDGSDENSLYCVSTESGKVSNIYMLDNDIGVCFYNEWDVGTAYIKKFNLKTGELLDFKTFEKSNVLGILNGSNINNNYLVRNDRSGERYSKNLLINISTLEEIDYHVIPEMKNTDVSELKCISNKYVVVKEDDMRGIIDYSGKIIIPIQYDDIKSNTNENMFAAVKNDKYGIIDLNNKTLLSFEYDGIIIENCYVVTLKDNRVAVLNKDLEKIYENVYDLYYNDNDYNIFANRPGVGGGSSVSAYTYADEKFILDIIENDSSAAHGHVTRRLWFSNNNYMEIDDNSSSRIIQNSFNATRKLFVVSSNKLSIYDEEFNTVVLTEMTVKYGTYFKHIANNYLQMKTKEEVCYIDLTTGKIVAEICEEIKVLELDDKYTVKLNMDKLEIYLNNTLIKKEDGVDITHLKDGYCLIETIEGKYKIVNLNQ